MIDITRDFTAAQADRQSWTEEKVRSCLQTASMSQPFPEEDWEIDEKWARVLIGDVVVLCVCTIFPVIFANRSFVPLLPGELGGTPLHVIPFDDFTKREFAISPGILEESFDREPAAEIDYAAASVEEIWFTTV